MTTNDENNLEIGGETPNLRQIVIELQQAQSDANWYYSRMNQARSWWRCQWPGQTFDGRKHSNGEEEAFPWENASDSRIRLVSEFIRKYVTFAKFSFWRARIKVEAMRPLVQGRDQNVAQKVIDWRVYTHMRPELLRELPLAWAWRFAQGCSLLSVEWQQQRRLDKIEISLPILDEISQAQGNPPIMLQLMDAIMDESQEDSLIQLVQSMSPIVTTSMGRSIVKDLRELRTAEIPIPYVYVNRPTWTALQPCIDVLFPSQTSDIQEARFVARRERVTETELNDRIETDNYDPAFVDRAVEQKGHSSGIMQNEPYPDYGYSWYGGRSSWGSDRELIELLHVYYKAITNGTPCVYKTVFNANVMRKETSDDPLYATHGLFEYQHGQYPFVVLRRVHEDRPILSSIGIAEEAYTDEQNLKVQQDGLTDRTSIIHRPPMIVPFSRAMAIKNKAMPGSVLEVNRPNEVRWMELPPTDATPVEIIKMIRERLETRYPLFGVEVDPELKAMHREETASDVLGEIELALEQTLQLSQQFEVDDEVAQVAGTLQRPFHMNRADIQGKHSITMVFDSRMIEADYFDKKFKAAAAILQTFNQGGIANTNNIERALFEMLDPDLADIGLEQSDQAATEREVNEEKQAFTQMMAGQEPAKPMFGNHQLRIQVLTSQAQQPNIMARLRSLPDTNELIRNRLEFFQNRIQQMQVNPQIGRATSTATFDKQAAPQIQTQPQPQ